MISLDKAREKISFRNKHSATAPKGSLTWSLPWTVKADHLESQETPNHWYNVPACSWSVLKVPSTLKYSDFYIYALFPAIPNPLSVKEENVFSFLNLPEHFLELWKNHIMTESEQSFVLVFSQQKQWTSNPNQILLPHPHPNTSFWEALLAICSGP